MHHSILLLSTTEPNRFTIAETVGSNSGFQRNLQTGYLHTTLPTCFFGQSISRIDTMGDNGKDHYGCT